ncbi:nucleotidyltransferase family protein [Thermus tengchongensis]|uniref:Polymerase nucleotidyl transferase domain-containing protein n=1 Tax=Thermus tengchongensis TaxID=1214928 RepID=A0A4Y9FE29_9DEIN|nr:nucleotidyltransferase domain-containing protein [Thermus tengchongensis]TFU27407.1 hypothetical protein E0687_01325 [Thermus tengchongensis]
MTREAALAKLTSPEVRSLLEQHRVRRLHLVGSHARGEAGEGSDLDLLVEFFPMPPEEHAAAYLGLLLDLEAILGCPVDLLEVGAVQNPFLRASLLKDRQEVYAA